MLEGGIQHKLEVRMSKRTGRSPETLLDSWKIELPEDVAGRP